MSRVDDLVQRLQLAPHPEGGRFRQLFRSLDEVQVTGRGTRSALTTIYYLLQGKEVGRWHRVLSDEVWHLYEGGPLELHLAPPDLSRVEVRLLDRVGPGAEPVAVVPAHWWQASRPVGDYALCGCTVGPGFEFADFSFLADDAAAVEQLRRAGPASVALL